MNTHAIDLFKDKEQYLYIDSGNQRGLSLTGDFTIEAWICLASLPSESNLFTILMKHDRVASTGGYEFYLNKENKLVVEYGDDDSKNTTAVCDYIFTEKNINVWKHIAVVVETQTTNITFYVDGQKQKTILQSDEAKSIQANQFPILVGATQQNEAMVSFFDGSLDEMRVWSQVKSEVEIQKNLKVELKGDEDGLQVYWKFDNSFDDMTANKNTLVSKNEVEFTTEVPFGGIQEKKQTNQPTGYVSFF